LEDGILKYEPKEIYDCIQVLRYVGHEPYKVVDEPTFKEIEKAGGKREGNRIHFHPRKRMRHPGITPRLKDLMEQLIKEWNC
jgi:hypothetical protein